LCVATSYRRRRANQRTPVPDARPVMLAALQASDGQAHGVLTGDVADAITQRFNATSPIFIDVTTETPLPAGRVAAA
jgi:hypothetical protein